jgi:GNAT superfamily N-acetyltransferase
MKLTWHEAAEAEIGLLADWNLQLIRDEQHRNPMNVEQLAERMRNWLRKGEYRAVLFSSDEPVCHAVFRQEPGLIHLRQFFVRRDRRRAGIGRAAVALLREQIWPRDVRLTVDVLCHNQGGVAFWRSVGYRDYNLTLEIMPPGA